MASSCSTYFQLPEYFKRLKPVQEEIAQTGTLAVRCVSKYFKSIFDQGLCHAWTTLKKEISNQNHLIIIFMSVIEQKHGKPNDKNVVRHFQLLKKEVHANWNKHFLFLDPSVDLPTQISFLGLLGVKYDRTQIPKTLEARAIEISHLKIQFQRTCRSLPVPEQFLDPKSKTIMTFPLLDASHPDFKEAMYKAKHSTHPLDKWSVQKMCHTREKETFYKAGLQLMIPSLSECVVCGHMINAEETYVDAVLQEEILFFLKNAIREVALVKEQPRSLFFMIRSWFSSLWSKFGR